MLGNIIGFIISVIALAGGAFLSYSYLEEKTYVSTQNIPQKIAATTTASSPVRVSVVQKSATTSVATKAVVTKAPVSTNGSLVPSTTTAQKTVATPGPLRAVAETFAPATVVLTVQGVVDHTNSARAQNGTLPSLTRNALLDNDAQMKLNDMFVKQYFEHDSPTGVGPADLAKAVGYAYVTVGENLALGDFASDAKLVEAWMNSPGHRANILNTHYQEIGVAVGKGMYEGRETWLAVQSFGTPLSACPAIDSAKKAQIDVNNAEIAQMRTLLDTKKALLDATPQYDANYNTYVAEFNSLISPYNTLVESNRVLVADYNARVREFNACIGTIGTTATH